MGAFPLGALAGGWLAAATGVRTVYVVAGLLNLLLAVGMLALVRAHAAEITAAFEPAATR